MKTPEKKVSEMTGKELAGSIAKGIVGGIFTLVALWRNVAHCHFCCYYQKIE